MTNYVDPLMGYGWKLHASDRELWLILKGLRGNALGRAFPTEQPARREAPEGLGGELEVVTLFRDHMR